MCSDIIFWTLVLLIFLMSCGVFVLLIRHNRLLSRLAIESQTIGNEIRGLGFFVRIIAYISIIVCLFICLHYLCIHHCRILPFNGTGADYLGVIVGIMAALVTLLVGWQIFSNIRERERVTAVINENRQLVVHINTTIKNFSDRMKELTERLEKMEECCEERKGDIKKLKDYDEALKLYAQSYYDGTLGELYRGLKSIDFTEAYKHTFNALEAQFTAIRKFDIHIDETIDDFTIYEYLDSLESDLYEMIELIKYRDYSYGRSQENEFYRGKHVLSIEAIAKWSIRWNDLYALYEEDILKQVSLNRNTEKFFEKIKRVRDMREILYELCKKLRDNTEL